ncbi:MAG: nuclear transport factor 2 family protein [Gammaproteobacteria bacterium]|nr:nuclear transport factor 2 family protein [Gammaproteobacteria bacterium]
MAKGRLHAREISLDNVVFGKFLHALAMSALLLHASSVTADTLNTPRGVVEAYHRALAEQDGAKVLSLIARNAVFFELGQAEGSRREYEQIHLASDMRRAASARLRRLSRRVAGSADVRWVLSVYRIEDGSKLKVRLAETIILKKQSGKWRIAHVHWSETPFSP